MGNFISKLFKKPQKLGELALYYHHKLGNVETNSTRINDRVSYSFRHKYCTFYKREEFHLRVFLDGKEVYFGHNKHNIWEEYSERIDAEVREYFNIKISESKVDREEKRITEWYKSQSFKKQIRDYL